MAQRCDWDRSEVFPAVVALAKWAKADGWRWPAEDNSTDPKPVMPAHINELIELRHAVRTNDHYWRFARTGCPQEAGSGR
jgi:hypothetical protein